jgi:hypothetical protein
MSGGREPRKRKLSGEGQDELSGGKRPSIDLENMDLTDPVRIHVLIQLTVVGFPGVVPKRCDLA